LPTSSLRTTEHANEPLLNLDTSLRSQSAAATLEAMAPYRTQLQILDLIDHTLESIPSVPIYEAVRPSSTSGYFCLGKGFSHQASMASALMEAAEMALVEQPLIATSVTLGSLAKDARIARPGWQEPLPCSTWSEPLAPSTAMLQGVSLIDGGAVFVPEIDVLYRPGWLGSKHGPSTNGLASGNSWNEALTHGLCELLERDAMKRWMLRAVFFPPELVPLEIDPSWDDSLQERLDPALEMMLYRVLQELVNNILKHAKASVVSIQLIRHEDSIVLQVEDNGVGFAQDPGASDGLGMTNIRSRVELLQGSFFIDSQPGHGTTAVVEVPVI
jgi:hypothetical protein